MNPSRLWEKGGFCRCLLKIRKRPIKTNDLTTNNCQFGVTESSSVGKCLDFIRLLRTAGWFIIFTFYFLSGLSWNFRSLIWRIKCQVRYNFLHDYSNDDNNNHWRLSHLFISTELQDGTKIILQNIYHPFPTSSSDLCSHSDLLQLFNLVILNPHPTSRLSLLSNIFKFLHSFPFFFFFGGTVLCNFIVPSLRILSWKSHLLRRD